MKDGAVLENIAATTVGDAGSLLAYDKSIGEYVLTDDVTITKSGASGNPTYKALLGIFEGTADAADSKTLNGLGHTITTEVRCLMK